MAQVLTWDVDYTPAGRPWSVVAVRDRRQLYEYIFPRSIVLVSADCFAGERDWLLLLRLALPHARLAVVGGGRDVPELFDCIAHDEIDAYVADSVTRTHCAIDTRSMFPRVHNALFPPPRYELIVFDLDGVLLKSDDYSLDAYHSGLRELFDTHAIEAPLPPREAIIPRLGVPGGNLYRDLLPEDRRDLEDELRALVRARFSAAITGGQARLFPGARETVERLRAQGRKLALVSHSPATYFRPAVAATELEPMFDALVCIGERPKATKADMIAEVMEQLGESRAVMVGDRKLDIDSGRANGCLTVGAAWGFAPPGELDDADILLADISELIERLETLEV